MSFLSLVVELGAVSKPSSCHGQSGCLMVGSVSRFGAGLGFRTAIGRPRSALMNQRQAEQVLLLLMSGCSLTARENSSPAVRALIGQMPGCRMFTGARGMQQENRSSKQSLATRLCSGRSYAPLKQPKVSSSSMESGNGFDKNSRTSGESRLSEYLVLPAYLAFGSPV
mgnify:CR=1 FL=1